jgi:hypothetical protein
MNIVFIIIQFSKKKPLSRPYDRPPRVADLGRDLRLGTSGLNTQACLNYDEVSVLNVSGRL